jgi:DNA-directed RNA polymerase subunit M/transcription elongation factor TFIIS
MNFSTRSKTMGYIMGVGGVTEEQAMEIEKAIYNETMGSKKEYVKAVRRWGSTVSRPPGPFGTPMENDILAQQQRNYMLPRDPDSEDERSEPSHGGSGGAPRTKCPRCKGTNVECTQMQTRSADEGMTVWLRCRDCPFVRKM